MGSPSTERQQQPRRGRRAPRMSGDERERVILETAERLLESRPLHEISVDDLARGAGISRSSFYFYFPSKEAVLLSLIDRVTSEAEAAREAALAGVSETDPASVCRAGIAAFYDSFGAHRALTLAAADARSSVPEAREAWSRVMDRWVDETAAVIEAERARGAAPDGLPARDLSVALNLMNERALQATFADERPSVAAERVVDTLVVVWLATIYGPPAAAGGSDFPTGQPARGSDV